MSDGRVGQLLSANVQLAEIVITAILMFLIGLHADMSVARDVVRTMPNRAAFYSTLVVVIVLVPAVTVIGLLSAPQLPPTTVLGILIVGLLPGGPMANVIALASSANSELNACLTAVEQCWSVGMVAFGLFVVYPLSFDSSQVFNIPFDQLLVSLTRTVLPLAAGMLASAQFSQSQEDVHRRRRFIQIGIFVAFAATVGFGAIAHKTAGGGGVGEAAKAAAQAALPSKATTIAACLFALAINVCGFGLAKFVPSQPAANRRSMILEVGIRDIALALPLITLGLPTLSLTDQARVASSAILSALCCNVTTVLTTLVASHGPCAGCLGDDGPPPPPAKVAEESGEDLHPLV